MRELVTSAINSARVAGLVSMLREVAVVMRIRSGLAQRRIVMQVWSASRMTPTPRADASSLITRSSDFFGHARLELAADDIAWTTLASLLKPTTFPLGR